MGKKIVIAKPDGHGTYTVWYSDGTMEEHIGISDAGGGGIKIVGQGDQPPVLGGIRGPGDPGAAIGNIVDAAGHGLGVANGILNPFQAIQQSLTDESEQGRQLRASARKAGYVVILVAFLFLFVYLTFKD